MPHVADHGLTLDIARAFGDDAAHHVTANLLPFSGPTGVDLVESRRRWIAGERVKPAALHVATIALTSAFREELTDALRLHPYGMLHNSDAYENVSNDARVGRTSGTRLIHRLVGMAAIEDAKRRGVNAPATGFWYSFGGILHNNVDTIHKHVDSRNSRLSTLRYVASAIGATTTHYLEELSQADVDSEDEVHTRGPSQTLESLDEGLIAVTLFELHTPHNRPRRDDLPRLFTTVDIHRTG